jgi:uncharacterized protein with GYD domain
MVRYLSLFTYSADGAKGFFKETATAREAAARKAAESLGGKFESFYWAASGEITGMAVTEFPDASSAARFALMVKSSGAFSDFSSTDLLSSDELDRAQGKPGTYRPPGG